MEQLDHLRRPESGLRQLQAKRLLDLALQRGQVEAVGVLRLEEQANDQLRQQVLVVDELFTFDAVGGRRRRHVQQRVGDALMLIV